MATFDRTGIAERLRELLGGPDRGNLGETAERLGIEELSLRLSIDELSPHPTVEVLAAVIREYGVDPTWLLTGRYDSGTHRSAMETDDVARTVRGLLGTPPARIAEPPNEGIAIHKHN